MAGQMNRKQLYARKPWTLGRALSTASLATTGMPVVNDVAGLLEDAHMYTTQPDERTWGNYGLSLLGALPFVPGMTSIKRASDGLDMSQEARMARAREMGFDVDNPVYHSSRHGADIKAFNSGDNSVAPFDAIGVHAGTADAARERVDGFNRGRHPDDKAGSTYNLLANKQRLMLGDDGDVMTEEEISEMLNNMMFDKGLRLSDSKDFLRESIWSRYDAIPYINSVEDKGSVSYIFPPQNLRSINAAFDPAKKDSANLLAGITGLGLTGLLGYGLLNYPNPQQEM